MKKIQYKQIRWTLLTLLGGGLFFFRWKPGLGEWYAQNVYPDLSYFLSFISSFVPFSLCEVTIFAVLLFLFSYPFKVYHKKNWKIILRDEFEVLAWIFVWFYWAWGINYYRDDFFTRAHTSRVSYQEAQFQEFLTLYTDSLNASFSNDSLRDAGRYAEWRQNIQVNYQEIPEKWGLSSPQEFQQPKRSLVNTLYSKVGVLGYIGPFFVESHVNHELPSVQYPFTYAHELSHLLGISSEAEANFWAYQTCVHSSDRFIRYSGYFGILPYVFVNARSVLDENSFHSWVQTIRPEVRKQLYDKQEYWNVRYSEWLGKIQSRLYNFYLKGNRIPSGQKNYAEVISMLLSLPEEYWK